MVKNISVEKKPINRTTHKKTTHNSHPNGVLPKNIFIGGRNLQKKILDNAVLNIALLVMTMGLAGTATFFILNKKNRRNSFNRRLYNAYNDIRDEARGFAHDAVEKGRRAYETAADYAGSIRGKAHDVIDQPYSSSLLVAGTVGGTILGASLVYLLSKDHKSDRNFLSKTIDVIDTIKDAASNATESVKSTDWGSLASDLIESLSEKLHEGRSEEDFSPRNFHKGQVINNLQAALDMGMTGFRLWQKLKNKRK